MTVPSDKTMAAGSTQSGCGGSGVATLWSDPSGPNCRLHVAVPAAWRCVTQPGLCPQEFYEQQEKLITAYREVEALRAGCPLSCAAQDDAETAAEQRAISASFICNVLLFAAKIAAAIMTGSMVVLVSTLDSALDLLSGGCDRS